MPIYLKYGKDIKGDVKEPAHREWIELESAQLGQSRGGSPTSSEIVLTKKPDSASVHLMREAISGKGVNAIIEFTRADGSVYLRVELEGTLISSYSISGTGGNASETLSLNFTKVEYKNIPGTPYGFDDAFADAL
jgi:type VI secretion system secreted protein Hcp